MPMKPTLAAHVFQAIRTIGLLFGAPREGVETRAGQILVFGRLLLELAQFATLLLLGGVRPLSTGTAAPLPLPL